MKKKLIQIIYDMRTQPVVAWVTVIGTALSIFLIMTVLMMQQVKVISIKPETHRDRMLYGMYIHKKDINSDTHGGSAGMSYPTAKRLYDNLDGVEQISYVYGWVSHPDVKGADGKKFTGDHLTTDDGFWRVYDHDLLAGRYYTADEVAAKSRVAVVSESLARRLFNGEDLIGHRFELAHNYFEVIGVVADVSKLASKAYAEIYSPINVDDTYGDGFGPFMAAMLIREGVDFEHIRDQVKKRYAELDAELAPEGMCAVYHGAPYDQETIADGVGGSNITPDTKSGKILRGIIYAILLIVPAINLSTMLHSRLRRRVSEIGIRRAFGCTRRRIIADIVTENLVVTVIGGIIGLTAGILFALFYDGLYTTAEGTAVHPALGLLLDWRILLWAFGACFVLNILSASVPAWQDRKSVV